MKLVRIISLILPFTNISQIEEPAVYSTLSHGLRNLFANQILHR